MLRRTKFCLVPGLFIACLLTGRMLTSLSAQTVATWNGGTGNWSNGALWSTGTVPDGAGFNVSIDGGKTGVASVVNMDGNYTVGSLTVDTGDRLNLVNGIQPVLTNTLTNNGTVNFNSTGSDVVLHLAGPTDFNGSGIINLTGVNNRISANNAGDRLSIARLQTIAGVGNLGNGTTTFTNSGSIQANLNGGTLTIQPGGGTGDFTNASGSGLLALNGGILALNGSNGTFTNNGSFFVQGGSAAGANSSLSVDAGRLTNLSGGMLTGGSYSVGGVTASLGTATLSLGGNVVINAANIALSSPGSVFTGLNTIASNQGILSVGQNLTFATTGALSNSGSLVSQNGATFQVGGALTQTSSGVLGGINGTFTASAFSLSGTVGPHAGNGPGSAGATMVIGNPGSMTLQGTVTLNSNAVLFLELGAATQTASDHLAINGAFTLDGRLDVAGFKGFGVGRYDLINYTGALTDNGLDLGTLPSGYNYAIDTSIGGQVDLVVTDAVPEPSTWAAMLAGGGFLALVPRRRARG